MSKFLALLDMELVEDANGMPLHNRDGRQLYKLLSDFPYQSDVAKTTITAKKGYITDLASVPQVMLSLLGEIAQMPGVIHDYLYTFAPFPRDIADDVLLEAMKLTGEPWWKCQAFYRGVRIGGASHYGKT